MAARCEGLCCRRHPRACEARPAHPANASARQPRPRHADPRAHRRNASERAAVGLSGAVEHRAEELARATSSWRAHDSVRGPLALASANQRRGAAATRKSHVDAARRYTAEDSLRADRDRAVHNVVRVCRVCFFARDSGRVELRIWRNSTHTVDELCQSLTSCHKPEIFTLCSGTPRSNLLEAFLARACSFHINTALESESFPPPQARLVGRTALIRMTGNIGHDLLLESFLDFYVQQSVSALKFDALLLEAFWFKGQNDWEQTLRARAKSWSFTMLEALFGSPETYSGAHVKMRRPRGEKPTIQLPEHGLCTGELFVRTKLEAGHAVWGNLAHVHPMSRHILRSLGLPAPPFARSHSHTEDSRTNDSSASPIPKVVFYTRGDARSRQVLLDRHWSWRQILPLRHANATIVTSLPHDDVRAQLRLFSEADVFIAPHGAASANSVFMRPGAAFIELTPFCDATCLGGCYSVSSPAHPSTMHAVSPIYPVPPSAHYLQLPTSPSPSAAKSASLSAVAPSLLAYTRALTFHELVLHGAQ